jgi:hypothetical protein
MCAGCDTRRAPGVAGWWLNGGAAPRRAAAPHWRARAAPPADSRALRLGAPRRSVHTANKLASKHVRIPFAKPASAKPARPPCDICQTVRPAARRWPPRPAAGAGRTRGAARARGARPVPACEAVMARERGLQGHRLRRHAAPRRAAQAKALFVCREDRAYLCRACDFAVHTCNAAAGAHERWFLGAARVELHAPPEEPAAPLSRAEAVKAAAGARAAAAAAAAAAQQPPPRARAGGAAAAPQPHVLASSPPPQLAQRPARSAGVQRVPSFNSMEVSLGMGDLLSFDKARGRPLQRRTRARARHQAPTKRPPGARARGCRAPARARPPAPRR